MADSSVVFPHRRCLCVCVQGGCSVTAKRHLQMYVVVFYVFHHLNNIYYVQAKKRMYIDPASGYKVFTAYAHLQRRKCCGTACRHVSSVPFVTFCHILLYCCPLLAVFVCSGLAVWFCSVFRAVVCYTLLFSYFFFLFCRVLYSALHYSLLSSSILCMSHCLCYKSIPTPHMFPLLTTWACHWTKKTMFFAICCTSICIFIFFL